MIFLIILAIVFVVFFFFRKRLERLILPIFRKIRSKEPVKVFGTDENTFSPVGTVREFSLVIQLCEQGDGKVKIIIKK